jgi:hypothetical protein
LDVEPSVGLEARRDGMPVLSEPFVFGSLLKNPIGLFSCLAQKLRKTSPFGFRGFGLKKNGTLQSPNKQKADIAAIYAISPKVLVTLREMKS